MKKNIVVICGGLSNERDISLLSGKQVYDNLDSKKYNAFLVDISSTGWKVIDSSKSGNFLNSPKKRTLSIIAPSQITIKKIFELVDVVFLAMHGKFGEDGHIQGILDIMGITYTGSSLLSSALAMDKYKTTQLAEYVGLSVPKSILVFPQDQKKSLYKKIQTVIGFPCFIKPNSSGSSVGAGIATDIKSLEAKIREAFLYDTEIVIQECIQGRELTCAVFGDLHAGVTPYPPIEIKTTATFFDRQVKYDKETIELCPAPLLRQQTKQIQEYATVIHEALGCTGITRSDFMLSTDGVFYFLETNTIPGLTETSLAPKEAQVAGISFPQYIEMQIESLLSK